jgi:iron-sulfur cluster assembly accessory protein
MAVIEPDKIQTESIETPALFVTPPALNTIRDLLVQREIPNHALRVFVTGGGCSGLQYGMAFEETPSDGDTVVEVENVRLLVDSTSMVYLRGATIDFVDSLMGGGFRIENPNSGGGCGCGKSFKSSEEEAEGTLNNEGGCGTCSSY